MLTWEIIDHHCTYTYTSIFCWQLLTITAITKILQHKYSRFNFKRTQIHICVEENQIVNIYMPFAFFLTYSQDQRILLNFKIINKYRKWYTNRIWSQVYTPELWVKKNQANQKQLSLILYLCNQIHGVGK